MQASAADRLDLLGNAAQSSSKMSSTGKDANTNVIGVEGMDEQTRRQRLQMMDNTAKFKQASNTLLKGERLLNQTEDVGNEVLTSLRGQTQTMHQINESTFAVQQEISATRKILSNMQRVMIKHKLILVSIILLLIFLIVVAIYAAVGRGRNRAYPTPTQIPVNPIPTSSMTVAPN